MADKKQQELIKTVAVIIVFSGVFGFVYWKYLFSPYRTRFNEANEKIEKINTDMAKAARVSKRLEVLTAELEGLNKRQQALEKRLPRAKKIPDLIYMLMDISRKYKVVVHTINPQGILDRQYYTEVNYVLSVSGAYHSLGGFLAALAVSERVFTVDNISISGSEGKIVSTFTLIAYQYKG